MWCIKVIFLVLYVCTIRVNVQIPYLLNLIETYINDVICLQQHVDIHIVKSGLHIVKF